MNLGFGVSMLLSAGVLAATAAVAAPAPGGVAPERGKGAVVVSKNVTANPTLRFAGVAGDPELSRAVESFLRASGWFDLTTAENADYVLSGAVRGDVAALDLTMGNAPLGTISVRRNEKPRELAKSLVDAVLENTFKQLKIKGFCHTKIAFAAETAKGIKNIYVCDIDGGDAEQVTNFPNLCVEPCFFPDSRSIGYTRYRRTATDILQTHLYPRMTRRLTALSGLNVGVAFSPDGSRLALISSGAQDHCVDLYVKPVGPGPMRRITRGKSVEASPVWSSDGNRICFVADDTGSPRLYVINADGSGRRRLPSLGGEAVTPDWSADDKIVYATKIDGSYTLAVFDVKTGTNRRATTEPGLWESPAWAPDNRHVVCKRSEGGKSSLYVVDTLTGQIHRLVAAANNLSMPAWSRGAVRK